MMQEGAHTPSDPDRSRSYSCGAGMRKTKKEVTLCIGNKARAEHPETPHCQEEYVSSVMPDLGIVSG